MTDAHLKEQLCKTDSLLFQLKAKRLAILNAKAELNKTDLELLKTKNLLEKATQRLSELKSGKGSKLAQVFNAVIYEYWLELPGYRGSVKGVTAKITETGSIQHVGVVNGGGKGGIGRAVVGGALLGGVGAVVGAQTRDASVNTEIKKIDNRQYEIEVFGVGFAWSAITGPEGADNLRKFRDIVNARSSNVDNVRQLIDLQHQVVTQLEGVTSEKRKEKESRLDICSKEENQELEIFNAYKIYQLPFHQELKARWKLSGNLQKVLFYCVVPILAATWFIWIIYGVVAKDVALIDSGIAFSVLHFAVLIGLTAWYFAKFRLFIPANVKPVSQLTLMLVVAVTVVSVFFLAVDHYRDGIIMSTLLST